MKNIQNYDYRIAGLLGDKRLGDFRWILRSVFSSSFKRNRRKFVFTTVGIEI